MSRGGGVGVLLRLWSKELVIECCDLGGLYGGGGSGDPGN